MKELNISVSAPAGLESVTKKELFKIIGTDAAAHNGRIGFTGNIETVAKCNLFMRTASRVFIVLGGFKANTFDMLFDGVYDVPFEEYISKDGKIEVFGSCYESKLSATTACAAVIKKSICKRLEKFYGSSLSETAERYKIEFTIRRDYVTLSLDTSGEGLNRRGYRKTVGSAPLKENVAAALIYLSGWKKTSVLADLFCGSGTIPIEAALIARNIPSGFNRDFDFLHYKNFNTDFYADMKSDAAAAIRSGEDLKIYGFDIDESAVKLSRKHAELAGVCNDVHFQKADMREFKSRQKCGVIISNLPYGERILTRKEIIPLYKDYGKVFRSLNEWSCHSLTSVKDFERLFGETADKKRKIYSGKLECCYYSVYGAKQDKKN